MKQTVIFFAIVIFAIVYWLINFVGDINEEFSETPIIHSSMDIGQKNLTLSEKKNLWATSALKEEIIHAFPDFDEIIFLVESELEEDAEFQTLVVKNIKKVQEEYISGDLTSQKAKASLSKL